MRQVGLGQGFRVAAQSLLLTIVVSAIAGHAVAAAVPLLADHPLVYRVSAHHPEAFRIALTRASAVQVHLTQWEGSVLVDLEPPGGPLSPPRYCQSGGGCVLPLTLLAPTGGTYRLVIHFFAHCCNVKSARGSLWVSVAHPASADDRLRAAAEEHVARAEWVQLNGPSKAWPGALEDYRAAVRIARRIGDAWILRVALPDEARLDTYELGHYHAALALAEQTAHLSYGADLPDEGFALFAVGLVLQYQARYQQAIRAERRALAILTRLRDRQGQDIVLGNLAGVYEQIGRTGLALRSAHRSLAIAETIEDGKGVDYNLELIAELHRDREEFNRAFAYFQRALEMVRRYPYPDSEARDWDGLGELYDALNEPAQARDAYRKAEQIAAAAHDSTALFRVLMDTAVVTRQSGHLRAALAYDQKDVARAAALGLPRQQSELMLELGRDYAALGQFRLARATFRRAAALAKHIGQLGDEATAWLALGDEEARTRHPPAARADYLRALALARQVYSPLIEAGAEGSLARLEFRQGALERAHRRIERAVELIGAVRSRVTTQALRTEYFASEHGYYDLGVSILMALRQRHPGKGYAREALQLVERARARSLLDALQGPGRIDTALLPAELLEQMRETNEQLDLAYAEWRDLLQNPSASPARFATLRGHIRALRLTYGRLETLARARGGRYAALADAHPASLQQLQRHVLGPHGALLEYWIGRHGGYAWLVRRRSITTLPLEGAEQLDVDVRALRRALTARSQAVAGEDLQQRAARIATADAHVEQLDGELGAQLLPASGQLRGVATLYVVADGPLFGVPFAALRPAQARRALMDSTAVIEEPSASVLAFLARRRSAPAARGIAVFADPVYRRQDPRFAAAVHPAAASALGQRPAWSAQARLAGLARLADSRGEALSIARLAGAQAQLHLGFGASVAAVEHTDWRRIAVAHFAVHTLLDADHPQLSGLVLSLFHSDGTAARGVLWLHDIYALHMPVNLVVLSSCRTLGGRDVPGEGLVGLFRAFLLAGAHAVLGTLWRVQDRATEQFMRMFYVNLLQHHMAPAEALRAAQRSMAHSHRYGAPYYWAGFSLEGKGVPVQ